MRVTMFVRPVLLTLAQLAGLLLFLAGFLLAKFEVTERSRQACSLPVTETAFSRVVWVVIDGLRYDQVASSGTDTSHSRALSAMEDIACELVSPTPSGLLASLSAWKPYTPQAAACFSDGGKKTIVATLQAQDKESAGAAVLARFMADAPTATLQRLRALLTGGMPTFFDISRSFSAGALVEDNLLHQLAAQGKRMVCLLSAHVKGLSACHDHDRRASLCRP